MELVFLITVVFIISEYILLGTYERSLCLNQVFYCYKKQNSLIKFILIMCRITIDSKCKTWTRQSRGRRGGRGWRRGWRWRRRWWWRRRNSSRILPGRHFGSSSRACCKLMLFLIWSCHSKCYSLTMPYFYTLNKNISLKRDFFIL